MYQHLRMRSCMPGRDQRQFHRKIESRIREGDHATQRRRIGGSPSPNAVFWVAHASRVLANASSRSRTFFGWLIFATGGTRGKDCFGATPKPARETRALLRIRLSHRRTSTVPDRARLSRVWPEGRHPHQRATPRTLSSQSRTSARPPLPLAYAATFSAAREK